jgi:hypothetical protein
MKKAVVYPADNCVICFWFDSVKGCCDKDGIDKGTPIEYTDLIPDWCPLDDWNEDIPEIDQEGG